MSAQRIAFASSKGGSGKTTICSSIAAFLAELGKKVLIIDCDEATHGMTLLHLDKVNDYRKANSEVLVLGLFDFLTAQEKDELFDPLSELARLTSNSMDELYHRNDIQDYKFGFIKINDNIMLWPATFSFANKQQETLESFLPRLKSICADFSEGFDYILLDAQAGTDIASKAALSREVADEIIIVSEFDPLSTAGIERMKSVLGEDLSFERTHILLNKLLPEFVDSFTTFLSIARYLPPIPWNADVVRAYSKRKLALDFISGNEFTVAMLSTIKAFLPEAEINLVDEWLEEKGKILKEPIISQLDMEIEQLKYNVYAKEQVERKKKNIFRISLFIFVSFALITTFIIFNYLSLADKDSLLFFFGHDKFTSIISSALIGLMTLFSLGSFFDKYIDTGNESVEFFDAKINASKKKIEELEFLRKANTRDLMKK